MKQCILRETGQISAHGIPYLLQSTVKSFLSGGAIKNHHRTIEMLNDRLKHFVYKYNEKSKKIFFVNEMGVFDDKDTDLSNNDNGRVQHRSRLEKHFFIICENIYTKFVRVYEPYKIYIL